MSLVSFESERGRVPGPNQEDSCRPVDIKQGLGAPSAHDKAANLLQITWINFKLMRYCMTGVIGWFRILNNDHGNITRAKDRRRLLQTIYGIGTKTF